MKRLGISTILAVSSVLIYGCGTPKTVVRAANDRSVVVRSITDDIPAGMKIANSECAKHGLKAKLVGHEGVDYFFDCVQ